MLAWSPGRLVGVVFEIYYIVLLVRVIMSFFPSSSFRTPAAVSLGRIVYALTEPLLGPIRRALRPYMGNAPVDFSPLILYLVLEVLEQLIRRML